MSISQQASTGSDVAKLFRAYAKKTWPKCKFSVTSSYSELNIHLMSAPFNVWADLEDPEVKKVVEFEKMKNPYFAPEDTIRRGEMQVNEHCIKSYAVLSDEAKNVLSVVCDFVSKFHWTDSDIMRDYYNTNFSFFLHVGKWNQKFQQIS